MEKRKIIEYKIVRAYSVSEVEANVNALLMKGWELRGQLKQGPRQVMVRYSEETNTGPR